MSLKVDRPDVDGLFAVWTLLNASPNCPDNFFDMVMQQFAEKTIGIQARDAMDFAYECIVAIKIGEKMQGVTIPGEVVTGAPDVLQSVLFQYDGKVVPCSLECANLRSAIDQDDLDKKTVRAIRKKFTQGQLRIQQGWSEDFLVFIDIPPSALKWFEGDWSYYSAFRERVAMRARRHGIPFFDDSRLILTSLFEDGGVFNLTPQFNGIELLRPVQTDNVRMSRSVQVFNAFFYRTDEMSPNLMNWQRTCAPRLSCLPSRPEGTPS